VDTVYHKPVYHKPVLLQAVLESLNLTSGCLFCDVTLGDGGYSQAILERLPQGGRVYGFDLDEQALHRAGNRLANFSGLFIASKGNFKDLAVLLHRFGVQAVDGIVCDLGVSTMQISMPERGFMFSASGPLDMRMSTNSGQSAAEVINSAGERELADIIFQYGEERQSRRIAAALVRERSKKSIETTGELAEIVRRVVGERFVIKSLARVFQSFRIFVNDELNNLKKFLPQALDMLTIGGRLAIVEYHSLEARIIKDFMQRESRPCTCPKDLPRCVCGKKPRLRVIHKLIKASAEEISNNPSARSARLRVVERIAGDQP
jgi:16S rRNA (cytosine1402-N4)-methyltransferase